MQRRVKVGELRGDSCPWRDVETRLVGSIRYSLLRRAPRFSTMPENTIYAAVLEVISGSQLWWHLTRNDSRSENCMLEMALQIRERIEAGMGGTKCPDEFQLFWAAIKEATPEINGHLAECSDCRSEVGWFKSQLTSYGEYAVLEL